LDSLLELHFLLKESVEVSTDINMPFTVYKNRHSAEGKNEVRIKKMG